MVELIPNIPNLSSVLMHDIQSTNFENIVYLSLHSRFPSIVLLSL